MLPSAIKLKSELIQERFMALSEFRSIKVLASYYPLGSEVRTFRIIERAFDIDRIVALPKINKDRMDFYEIEANTNLYTNKFGIKEPPSCSSRVSDELDLLLVPGLAFDTSGYRIGYGYGYYDKFLANKGNSITSVGLAYDSQVVEQVPHLCHDKKLDILLTDRRTFHF
jgi:5-formyltetrahydrofolate cyclo-ligase